MRAHRLAKAGKYERIARGIYLRADLSPSEKVQVVREHAVRIALTMAPNAALAGPCALSLSSAGDHILLAGRRYAPERVVAGALRIRSVIVKADKADSGDLYIVDSVTDPLGTLRVKRLSDLGLILHALQAGSRTATQAWGLSLEDRLKLFASAKEQAGSSENLISKLTSLATANGLSIGLKRALEQLAEIEGYRDAEKYQHAYRVFWHDIEVGRLVGDDQLTYRQTPTEKLALVLSKDASQRVPKFIASMLFEATPSTDFASQKPIPDELPGKLGASRRLLSNLSICQISKKVPAPVIDVLDGRLKDYRSNSRVFTGSIDPDLRSIIESSPASVRQQIAEDFEIPLVGGTTVNVPVHLDASGQLSLAKNKAFTHILKLSPHTGLYRGYAAVEWYGLNMMRAAGVSVEEYAMVNIAPGLPPAMLAERFDIRESEADTRRILTEDFASILEAKTISSIHNVDLLDVGDALAEYSTSPKEDGEALLRMTMLNWIIANGNAHAKNHMLVKVADAKRSSFESVRLAPAFDVMSTAPYYEEMEVSAGLPINRKVILTIDHFFALGGVLGIEPQGVVDVAISTINRLDKMIVVTANAVLKGEGLDKHLAKIFNDKQIIADLKIALEALGRRLNPFSKEFLDWTPTAADETFSAERMVQPIAATEPDDELAQTIRTKDEMLKDMERRAEVIASVNLALAGEQRGVEALAREYPEAARLYVQERFRTP